MNLLIIARFLDPQEAHIAAGALVSKGYDATVRDLGYGAVDPLMRQATGGFPLLVPEDQADSAQAYLDTLRAPKPDEALNWRKHPKAVRGLVWTPVAFIGPEIAMLFVAAKVGPAKRRFWAAVGVMTVMAALVVLILYGALSQVKDY